MQKRAACEMTFDRPARLVRRLTLDEKVLLTANGLSNDVSLIDVGAVVC